MLIEVKHNEDWTKTIKTNKSKKYKYLFEHWYKE